MSERIKILVTADSHGDTTRLQRIISREEPFGVLIHCGDGVDDLEHVRLSRPAEVLSVAGNMDRSSAAAARERLIETTLGGVRFLICHGDRFAVHHDYGLLLDEGLRRGADIICCGHTHIPFCRNHPPLVFNPGPADRGLYGTLILAADQAPECRHKQL